MKASPSAASPHRGDVAEILEAAATASNEELVRACQRLATERARYYDLFASSRDACLITDAKGVIREANRRAGETLGMAPAVLRGKLLIAFVVRGDTREFRGHLANLAELAKTGTPVRLRMRARNGGAPFQTTLWVDGGRRSTSDEPISYRWTIVGPAPASADPGGLDEVLSAVAMLARSMPSDEGEVTPAERIARVGDLVARTIQRMSATAEQRSVRFAVEGGDLPDHVHAAVPRLEQSIGTLLGIVLAATPDGAELRIRLGRHEGYTLLDVHVDRLDAHSMGSPLSIVHLAARLAADGGRLEIASPEAPPLMRVRWPAVG